MTLEWNNLASDTKFAGVIGDHARWLPKTDVPPAPGSAQRILVRQNGLGLWEEMPIKAEGKQD